MIPGKDPPLTAAVRQAHFNRVWAKIIHALGPRFGFPFAADVVFLDRELSWCNEAVHNAERPTEVFERLFGKSTGVRVLDIAPGFVIEHSSVARTSIRQPLAEAGVQQAYTDAIARVNRTSPISAQTIQELKELLEHNIARGEAYLGSYEGDYRCLVQIKGAAAGIRVEKIGRRVTAKVTEYVSPTSKIYDVVYRTRASYLRLSLTTAYGHEILFVGSGGIFEISDRAKVRAAIHRELMTILRPFDPQAVRPATRRSPVLAAKRILKRLLGVSREDLYDLEKWTIFTNRRQD